MLESENEAVSVAKVMGDGISVITAVGPQTTEEQLVRCLTSVAEQALVCPLEHVIVFDGTTAYRNCHKIVEEIASINYANRPSGICMLTVPWSGPGFAKTQGLNAHRYKYVAFLDSDDTFTTKNSLQGIYEVARATGADITQGQVVLEDGRFLLDPTNHPVLGKTSPILKSKREIFEVCQVFKRANVAGKLFNSLKVSMKYNVETDMCDDVYGVVEAMYNAETVAVTGVKVYTVYSNPYSVSKAPSYTKLLAIRQYATWAREFAREHCLILPDKYYRDACYDFTLFGKRFLRVNKWKYRTQVYLFGKLIWQTNIGL